MFLIIFFLLAILSYVLIYLVPILFKKNEPIHPPPGPKGLPIIGNLHQFDALQPEVYFANLAKIYGPIVRLRLGHTPVVVVQSANLAKEVLKTQDLNFCGRPPMVAMRKLSYNCIDISFCPYNDYYREIKKLAIVHLFNTKRVESFAPIRQEEFLRMIEHISSVSSASEVVNLSELLIRFACAHICKVAFGKRYDDETGSKSKFHNLISEAESIFTSFFFSDFLPFIGWLDYLTGQFTRLEKIFKKLDDFYEEIINDHLHPINKSTSNREDIIDVLLNLKSERPFQFTLDHIKAVLMDIFLAGTGTSSSTVIWAMTELVKNPNMMKKVQEELRSASKNKGYIDNNEDLMDLVYFKAVVKETFRLHPPVPLLIVRETIRKSTIEDFDIQPKTLLYVNALQTPPSSVLRLPAPPITLTATSPPYCSSFRKKKKT